MGLPGPIALFDSGEGGLTVLRQLMGRFSDEQFLYAADSAHFPYGEKTLDEVREWFLAYLDFFLDEGAQAVVIACNTATAAALDIARARTPIPVIGVVEPAVQRATAISRNHRIGVLSTEATFHSGLYPKALKALEPSVTVISKPCPILVIMAENGHVDGRSVEDEVQGCVMPVLEEEVDTIILGCTHFPHMRRVFNRVVGDRIHIVDPGEEIAAYLEQRLDLPPYEKGAPHPVQAWTSGNPDRFITIADKLCPEIPMVARPLYWDHERLSTVAPRLTRVKSSVIIPNK